MRNEDLLGLVGGVFGCSIILLFIALALVIWWKIFDKAGYGGPFGLLMVVPIANIVMLCILAFGKWPVLQELESLRRRAQNDPRVSPGPPVGG